jgi:uncharacterized membrane protein YhaH (DUF805 family)
VPVVHRVPRSGWPPALAVAGWLAFNGFLTHPLDGPGSGSPYVDMPYHLALAAELKHHFPPKMPFVIGQPLSYHWFVHANLAASSWTSGLELHEILYRFAAVPLAVLTPVLVALLAARASGRIWTGPVAAALTVFVRYFSPYGWSWAGHPAFEPNLLTAHIWASPTQNYGLVLFLPLVLLLVDRLRDVDRPSGAGARGQWAMILVLLIATMGGKATFLPLLLAGVGVAGLIGLAVRRRIERPLWIVGVLGLVGLVYATGAVRR